MWPSVEAKRQLPNAASRHMPATSGKALRAFSQCATRSMARPPNSPPSVALAVMRPIACLSVCGSKRSFTTDQNALTSNAPPIETCK